MLLYVILGECSCFKVLETFWFHPCLPNVTFYICWHKWEHVSGLISSTIGSIFRYFEVYMYNHLHFIAILWLFSAEQKVETQIWYQCQIYSCYFQKHNLLKLSRPASDEIFYGSSNKNQSAICSLLLYFSWHVLSLSIVFHLCSLPQKMWTIYCGKKRPL